MKFLRNLYNAILIFCFYNYGVYTLVPIYKNLDYGDHNFTINNSVEYILDFKAEVLVYPPRITITSYHQDIKNPLMIVARKQNELLSWMLPMSYDNSTNYFTSSRTLCHGILGNNFSLHLHSIEEQNPVVSISTSSQSNINFEINVNYQKDFFIDTLVSHEISISPSEPKYFFYNASLFDNKSSYETVILEVHSNDSVCMTISIQNSTCPVFDTNEDITFRGFYETVNTQGGITIPKNKFPFGFFVVFVAKLDDYDCLGFDNQVRTNRTKTLNFVIKPSISYEDYVNAILITLASVGVFYMIFIVGLLLYSKRNYIPRQMGYVSSTLPIATNPTQAIDVNYGDDISIDETEYDAISTAEEDQIIRLATSVVYLNNLARKDPRVHKYKSYHYLYNVLTIALFYGLPVIQLVVTYQRILNETGQQDICYYNFFCAHPLGVLSDFNHVFSNSGYILFGFLFLGITYNRETTHKDLSFDREYGIPQHYGIFYAIGVALVMEGVLSASYHVCPNQANFQFDSSFMYIMAVLCMVKLYQNRHPDINASAYATFGVLAIAILLGMIGILNGNLIFWIIFTIIYLVSCLYISIIIYYMGCRKLDKKGFLRVWRFLLYDFASSPINAIKPLYKTRMVLLIIGNICNWALAVWGLYDHQKDFALFLLAIFMGNTLLYFVFYITMKYINEERVTMLTWFFLLMSTLCASAAMYFFLNKSISWSNTPAVSRQFNQECKLLRFYDFHDIWHFLSATGMFFMFMVLLTLDDDLSHVHRNKIVVF